MRVYEVITKYLESYGVRTVFGYAGGNVSGLYRAVASSNIIKFVPARHEQAPVHAAEGYARASGDVGVAIVSSGPADEFLQFRDAVELLVPFPSGFCRVVFCNQKTTR